MTPITIRGRYFWKGDERFLIKGVVYQQYDRKNRGSSSLIPDPLADDQLGDLKLSIPLFKELGLNTLFIYSVDATKNHDKAMDLLAEAGIYVLACISTVRHHIQRSAPFESYTPELLQHCFRAVDVMARYPNTLGLIVANEVINSERTTRAAPVIRALTRDVRRYMRLVAAVSEEEDEGGSQRMLPLGVSAADVLSVLMSQYAYLCGESEEEDGDGALDFFSFNSYSWSGHSSMAMSGFDKHVKRFSHTPIPVFLSEYGSNAVSPRPFGEARALCSPAMTGVFSGGIAYEFFLGPTRYGLVEKKKTGSPATTTATATKRKRRSTNYNDDPRSPGLRDAREEDEDEKEDEVYLEKAQDYENLQCSLRAGAQDELVTLPEFASPSTPTPTSMPSPERPPVPGRRRESWRPPPGCPLDWEAVRAQVEEDRQWVDVGRDVGRLSWAPRTSPPPPSLNDSRWEERREVPR